MSYLDLGTLGIEISADTTDFSVGLGAAEKKLDKVGDKAEMTGTTIDAAFVAAAGAVAGFLGLLHASSEAQEAQIRLANAIKAAGANVDIGAINALGAEIQKLTVYDDAAVASASAMAVSLGLYEDEIITLMPLVADLAAKTGGDLTDAMQGVATAIATGQTRALKSAGIVLDEATKKTFENADATERTVMMAEKLKGSVGGLAVEMAKTTDGAIAQMTNEAMNLGGAMGGAFGPAVVDALGEVTGLIEDLRNVFSKLGSVSGVIVDVLMAPIKLMIKYQRFLMDFWGSAAELAGIDLGSSEMELIPLVDSEGNVIGGPKKGVNNNRAKKESMLDFSGLTAGMGEWTEADFEGFEIGDLAQGAAGWDMKKEAYNAFIEAQQLQGENEAMAADARAALRQTWAKVAAEDLPEIVNTFLSSAKEEMAAEMFAQEMQAAALDFGAGFVSRMGDFGNVMSSTIQAGMQGGPMAALGTLALELLTRTESFAKITEIMNDALSHVVEAVDPLMNALIPVADAVEDLLQTVSKYIQPLFKSLGGIFVALGVSLQAIMPALTILQPAFDAFAMVMSAFARVFAGAMFAIIGIVYGLVSAWNGILEIISDVLWEIDSIKGINVRSWAEAVDDAKISTGGLTNAMDTLSDIMTQGTDEWPTFDTDLEDTGDALGGLSDAAEKASESLLNVPTGYKVALERFEATDPVMNLGGGGMGGGGDENNMAQSLQIGNVYITTTGDAKKLWEDLKKEMEYDRYQKTGSPFGGNAYATPSFSSR